MNLIDLKDEIEHLRQKVEGLQRQLSGRTVRYGDDVGGIGNHFQLVRGVTTAAVVPTDPAFQITVTDKIEQFASDPGSPLWVKAASGGVTLAEGDEVLAGYRENALTFDPGGGSVQVDWIQLLAGSASTPPLRAFELTANKTLAQNSATVKWLDLDGDVLDSDVTIYDPEQRFAGRIANDAYSGSPGFRGQALFRTDLAAEDPDRWEIVELDSFSEFIRAEIYKVSNYPSPGSTVVARFVGIVNAHGYDDKLPNAAAGEVGYLADLAIFDPNDVLAEPDFAAGEESGPVDVLMQLVNPDSDPPEYRVYGAKSAGGSGDSIRFFLNQHRSRAEPIADSFAVSVIDDNDNTIAQATVYDREHRYFGIAGSIGVAVHNGTSYKCVSLQDLPEFAFAKLPAGSEGFDYDHGGVQRNSGVLAYSGPPDMQSPSGAPANIYDENRRFINLSGNDTVLAIRRPRTTDDTIENPDDEANFWNYHVVASMLEPEMIWAWSEQTAADETTPVFSDATRRVYVGRRIKLHTGYGQSFENIHYKDLGEIRFFFPDGSLPTLHHKQRLTGFQVFYDDQGHTIPLYVITQGTGSPIRYGVTGSSGLSACVFTGSASSGYGDMGFGDVYPYRRSPNPLLPKRIERDDTITGTVQWLNSMLDPVCPNRPVTGVVDGGQIICVAEGWRAVA